MRVLLVHGTGFRLASYDHSIALVRRHAEIPERSDRPPMLLGGLTAPGFNAPNHRRDVSDTSVSIGLKPHCCKSNRAAFRFVRAIDLQGCDPRDENQVSSYMHRVVGW
jgi:hypothetical protein